MKEDLIEIVTSQTIKGLLAEKLVMLCRLSTRQDELLLAAKFREFNYVSPEQLGVPNWFTLNKSSKMLELFK